MNAPVGMLYPGDSGFPDGGYNSSCRTSRRAPASPTIFGDGKTSLRAGYGMFYDKPNTITTNSAATQGPFGTVARADGNALNSMRNTWAGGANPFPVESSTCRRRAGRAAATTFSYAENIGLAGCTRGTSPASARSSRPGWCASPTPARAATA